MTSVARGRVREVPAKASPALPGPPRGSTATDVAALKRALRAAVQGEVRFDPGTLAMYGNDASNYRHVPIGVVVPRTLDDVVAAHPVCSEFGAPVLNRGGGTSLSGETVNCHSGVGVACVQALEAAGWRVIMPEGHVCRGRPLYDYGFAQVMMMAREHASSEQVMAAPEPSRARRAIRGGWHGIRAGGARGVR